MLRPILLSAVALGFVFTIPADAKKNPAVTVKLFDTDNDGTVDLAEAKKAAGALFDKLNTDKDDTISAKELQGRLSKVDLAAADPDKDGTLQKPNTLLSSKPGSRAADPDNDGTIDVKRSRRRRGKEPAELIK